MRMVSRSLKTGTDLWKRKVYNRFYSIHWEGCTGNDVFSDSEKSMGRTVVLNLPRLLSAYSKEEQPWSRNVLKIDQPRSITMNQVGWALFNSARMEDTKRNLPESWQATSKLLENSAAPSCSMKNLFKPAKKNYKINDGYNFVKGC